MTWTSSYSSSASSSSYPTTTASVIETITPTQSYPSATAGQWTTTEALRTYPTATGTVTATTSTTVTVTASMASFNPTTVASETTNSSNDSIPSWLKALLVLLTIASLILMVLGFKFMKKRRSQQTYEPVIELKNGPISFTEQSSDIPVGIPIDLSKQRGHY
eukprot:CAMPEP_0176428846 /NCGR_PEP_ID=MMETSP0127-20121128/13379_1 /TAXON_ID=938130 /ORGANISM="Platyophrya macrostoma, Strain WH" /LENGTH=161 /DNA_ID=CAMNT_0017810579 /DNA_START=788 /DNA_END=1273 /DNA_ORIENTATION=+